jgi:soluble lytic murein transglycosylase-like protein
MDRKVNQRLFAGLTQKGLEKKRESKNSGPSFGEILASRKGTPSSQGISGQGLPDFPSHKARAKTISVDQAEKLAKYSPLIKNAAIKHNVPIELICGVILKESGGNPKAVSPAGARGLMQLMPQTARRFGVRNSFDPAQNIDGGTKYLRFLLDRFNGNVELTLAGYNAGEQNVAKYGNRVPPFAETQNYVPDVLGYAQAMIEMLASRNKIG